MQLVYFKMGASEPVGLLLRDGSGRIDFSPLCRRLKLDPTTIELNGILLISVEPLSEETWDSIENFFKTNGMPVGERGDPVIVTGEAAVPAVSTAGQATSEEADRLQKVLEGVQMLIERSELEARKKSHRISEANSTAFQEIRSSGCIEGVENVLDLFDAQKHKTRDVPEFKWKRTVESAQAGRYVKHVEEHLVQSKKEKEWLVINGNKHPKLLNGFLNGTEFRGTTDVVVVQRDAEGLPQSGMKILFELKKVGTISEHAEYQTIFSLLLANTICRHLRPIAVLTDLVDMWVLYYCDRSIVYRHKVSSRSKAVGYLDAILENDTDPEDVSDDTRHGTPALRSPEESSSRGVKRSFSGRRKFSIPSLEQLEELAGFLSEDELWQGRAAIARQCVLTIPGFYSVVSDLRKAPEGMYS